MNIRNICFLEILLLSLIKIYGCLDLNFINLKELKDLKIPKNIDKANEFSEIMNTSNSLENIIKRTACLALVRNLIANKDSRIFISKENLTENLENDFDKKILLRYVKNCEAKISVGDANEILSPQNILSTDEKFVSNILVQSSQEFNLSEEEEREILRSLSLNSNEKDDDDEEEVKIESKNKKYLIIFSLVAFILIVLIVRNLRKKEPEISNKKKNKKRN